MGVTVVLKRPVIIIIIIVIIALSGDYLFRLLLCTFDFVVVVVNGCRQKANDGAELTAFSTAPPQCHPKVPIMAS